MNAPWTGYLPQIIREWLAGRQQLQKTISNTGWLLLDRSVRIVIGLTIGAWIARYLGPPQFGKLAYVISFIAFFQVISTLQGDGFIVRDIAQSRAEPALILGTALRLRLILGAASWLGATGLMFLLHPEDPELYRLTFILGGAMIFQAADTVDLWFQSQSMSRHTVMAKLSAYLCSNGLKVALLILKAPLMAFAAVICLESALLALALAVAYRRRTTGGAWRGEMAQARQLLKLCWPFIISSLMVTVFMRIDQIMLKEMTGERELGIYAAALVISQAWSVIPTTMAVSLAPFVARRMALDEKLYQDALVKIFRLFALVSLTGALLTALASPWIIRVMYGPAYDYSSVILRAHVFVNVIIFQGIAQGLWVVNKEVRIVTLAATSIGAAAGILSNAALIHTFGILGAVAAYYVSQGLSIVIIPCLCRPDLLDLYKRAYWWGARK